MERIDCRKCAYFKVTWEVNFPYSCGFFGFKGKTMPSQTVFSTSGARCEEFKPIDRRDRDRGEDRKRV